MQDKIKVGQIIYLRPMGSNRYPGIRMDVVIKVGKKYFELEGISRKKFLIDRMVDADTGYGTGHDWKCYFTRQEIEDEDEFEALNSNIKYAFGVYSKIKLSLDQLRRINKIVDEAQFGFTPE